MKLLNGKHVSKRNLSFVSVVALFFLLSTSYSTVLAQVPDLNPHGGTGGTSSALPTSDPLLWVVLSVVAIVAVVCVAWVINSRRRNVPTRAMGNLNYCPSCGVKVDKNTHFCPNCGLRTGAKIE